MMPCEIKTTEDFDSFTNSDGVVVIHFWAEWNGTDYVMKEVMSELENYFKNNAHFALANVENEILANICRDIPITNVPTVVFFKNGKQTSVQAGFNPRELENERAMIKLKISSLIDF